MKVFLFLILSYCFPTRLQGTKASFINGRHLSIVAAELPLTFHTKTNNDGAIVGYGGPTYRLVEWLSARLNFTYTLHVLETFDFGEQVNGTYTGLLGYLYRKESDIALSAFSYVRVNSFLDASAPWAVFDFSIQIPYPEEETKTWAALKPFQPQVWLCVFMSLLGMAVVIKLKLVHAQQNKLPNDQVEYGPKANVTTACLMYLFGVLTGQGGYLNHKGRRILLLGVIWCMACFVLISAYSSLLISFLSTTKLIPVADSAREMSQKLYQVPLYTFKGSMADRYIMNAQDGDLRILGDYLRRNPVSRKQTSDLCSEEALKQNGACFSGTGAIHQFIYDHFKRTKQCKLSRSKEILFPTLVALLYQKRSPYANELDYQILWATAHGIINKWFHEDFNIPHKCLERIQGQAKNRPLAFTDLRSAFLILAIGGQISIIAVVAEVIIGTNMKRVRISRSMTGDSIKYTE